MPGTVLRHWGCNSEQDRYGPHAHGAYILEREDIQKSYQKWDPFIQVVSAMVKQGLK